eukprot:TRINITY_DN17463_c0_g1_i1.p1 TRINITY_DN17463_c0_g1~~TRINITY_DN17463_c0_g1_i1.p1  ORF type:complete len:710 (+),score=152.39 TRINITY_DN17463_c0_g1_i1:44-2173(+)
MWKKPLGKFQTQPLKGKDVKNLKRVVGDEALKGGSVSLWKVEPRLHVYAVDGVPMFVDNTGKLNGQILPTVFALRANPEMLPTLYVIPDVSRYVLNGADLMWPGVFQPAFTPTTKDGLVSISVIGNPVPFAIGRATCDTELPRSKGKAVTVIHYWTDTLCTACSVKDAFQIDGFFDDCIKPTVTKEDLQRQAALEGEDSSPESDAASTCSGVNLDEALLNDDDDDDEPEPASEPQKEECSEEDSDTPKKGKRHERMAALKAKKEQKSTKKKKNAAASEPPPAEEELSPEQMDEVILGCCAAGLSKMTKADLPMLVSTFYSQWVLPCRPAGVSINLKRASFKKIGNLMTLLVKEKVITIKQKKEGVDSIIEMDKKQRFFSDMKKIDVNCDAAATPSNDVAPTIEFDEGVLPLGRLAKLEPLFKVRPDSPFYAPVASSETNPIPLKQMQSLFDNFITQSSSNPDSIIKTREGIKGGKGSLPDPWVTLDPVLRKLWPEKGKKQREVTIRRLRAEASLGFVTDAKLFVNSIEKDGLAEGAGLLVGDELKKINDTPVKGSAEVGAELKKAGAKPITLTVLGKDLPPKEAYLSDIRDRFIKLHTLPAWCLHYTNEPKPIMGKGKVPTIDVKIQRVGGNKVVTEISNLEKYGFDLPATSKELRNKFAVSVWLDSETGKILSLQGKIMKKLAEFFRYFGIPKEYILIWDKTAPKKKK